MFKLGQFGRNITLKRESLNVQIRSVWQKHYIEKQKLPLLYQCLCPRQFSGGIMSLINIFVRYLINIHISFFKKLAIQHPWTDLTQFHGSHFGFIGSFTVFTFSIFGLSITEET
jgi:hypothetical protein